MRETDPWSEMERKRWTFAERAERMWAVSSGYGWHLSPELFGDVGCNINDFMTFNYVHLLDHAWSVEDLIAGLQELSPIADDALDVAIAMTAVDFAVFKLARARDKASGNQGPTAVPQQFFPLLIPARFIKGVAIAEKFNAPLGAVLIREMERENGTLEF